MIWKIVIIILCLFWWLPIVYMWFLVKRIKKYEDYLDNENECYDMTIRAYHLAVADMQKEFDKLKDSMENQRKMLNGWEHKIAILDRDIRKPKNYCRTNDRSDTDV